MTDTEQVIFELEFMKRDVLENSDKYITLNKAIALLKEQNPVKPHYNARTNWYECGACHYSMTSGMHCRGELIPAYKANYCAKCGKGGEVE